VITCRELAELLIEFIADELPGDRKQHVEQHLGRCPPCLAYLETYRAVIRLTRRLPCHPPPPELMQRLRVALKDMPREQPPPPPPPVGGCR
jgi:anti-sigma factor RsiW